MDSIHRVQEGLQLGLSGDLVSEDLRQCIHELSEIVAEGGITSEETLQIYFKTFASVNSQLLDYQAVAIINSLKY